MKMTNEFKVQFSNKALKRIKKVRKTDKRLFQKITTCIEAIKINPYIGDPKTGDLEGYRSCDIYHMRTNYELCYRPTIDEEGNLIYVILFGSRERFYEELKRLI